jgi:solute carrier family 25 folate transporter 32
MTVAVLTHPLCVIKTRQQDERARTGAVQYHSFPQAGRLIWQREGLRHGLFRGLVPSLAQTMPRSVLQLVLFEACLAAMPA